MSAPLVEALFDAIRSGEVAALDEVLSPDCVDHDPMPYQPPGRVGVALKMSVWRALAPGFRTTVEAVREDVGETVATWLTTVPGGQARWEGRFGVRAGRISSLGVRRVG